MGAEDDRAVTLTVNLGKQIQRLGRAGAKITQFLSMVQLEAPSEGQAHFRVMGRLPEARKPLALRDVQRVIEQDLNARMKDLFESFDEKPFAISSLGQVHRARTCDGERVAVKVQQPDIAAAISRDLRNIALVRPIVKHLAPGSDAAALLAEVRERIGEELDYEIEALNQQRLSRVFRGHPHVLVPRVNSELSSTRVLVSEYVEGLPLAKAATLPEPERDRVGEIVVRFFFSLPWRERIVLGDPHLDNCILCPDGRLCLVDFALLRRLDPEYLAGEQDAMRAVSAADPTALHGALADLGYLADGQPYNPDELLEHLSTAGEWLLKDGFRRIDPGYVRRIIELGYPPHSPWFSMLRRMTLPPPTLLLRRMEVQTLFLLGELQAGGNWAAIASEQWAGQPPSTRLGEEDAAFFAG